MVKTFYQSYQLDFSAGYRPKFNKLSLIFRKT